MPLLKILKLFVMLILTAGVLDTEADTAGAAGLLNPLVI